MLVFFFFMALAEPRVFTLGAGGDVGFGRYMKSKRYRQHGGEEPFSALTSLFAASDLVFVNLETPLYDRHPPNVRSKRPLKNRLTFRSDTRYAQLMQNAGIDLVSLANNHMEDCSREAIQSTVDALDLAKLHHVGAHTEHDPYAPIVFQHDSVDVVVFARSTKRNKGRIGAKPHPDIAYVRTESILETSVPLIAEYKAKYPSAIFVFSIHWGGEYMDFPVRIQQTVARGLIDAGVHAVLGHHAHVLQPVEVYNSGVILYSMGNFIFDQSRVDTHKSAFFMMDFSWDEGWKPSQLRIHPLKLSVPPITTKRSGDQNIVHTIYRNGRNKRYRTPLTWTDGMLVWEPKE